MTLFTEILGRRKYSTILNFVGQHYDDESKYI